jgi:hypothetical protein
LSVRALCVGIDAIVLTPALKDFNDDLRQLGVEALQARLREQLRPEDVSRFMALQAVKLVGMSVRAVMPDRGESPAAGKPRPRACEGAI